MDLILTHEQTDLDGLASMLGAHLLRPEAIALLPRQINRNGKAFLRRYANELPFSDYQALPHESISSVFRDLFPRIFMVSEPAARIRLRCL